MQDNTAATPSPENQTAKAQQAASAKELPRTTGEKWFSIFRFAVGEVTIVFITAVLAYVARYGKDTIAGIPNYLRQFDQWMTKTLLDNKTFPLRDKGERANRMVGAIVNTTILMQGGNVFVPIMKGLENRKEKIVTFVNKRWGKPGEVEIGQQRVRAQPQQSWGDIIKGRFVSWLTVFVSFMGIDTIAGKNKEGKYWLDVIEESIASKTAYLTAKGRQIASIPDKKQREATYNANNTYRFGKILALDIYATAASLLVWIGLGEYLAKKRGKDAVKAEPEFADPLEDIAKDIVLDIGKKPKNPQPVQNKILAEGSKSPTEWARSHGSEIAATLA
jgi:hypothetical protein